VPDSCNKVAVLGVGQRNDTIQTGLQPTRCHGNQIFAFCHNSSASVKHQRATITNDLLGH